MFSSELSVTLVLFLRNIIVARLISVEDFGIASTFAVLFAVIETLGNMALNKLIVQDAEGENLSFQNTLHSVQLIRGVIGAITTVLVAYPYAHFMNTPDIVWAYQWLALIPLARGFLHLDIYRVQRRMHFMPYAITMVVSPIVSLGVILAVWTVQPDYQIMLWGIIAQQILQVALSHVLAERRFGLAWNRVHLRRALKFGWPLLLNGLALLVVSSGERLIVGNQTDLVVLAWFSMAFLLATAPTRIVLNTSQGLFLPKLSAVQSDAAGFARLSLLSVELNLWLGTMTMAGLAVFGPVLILALFGERYAPGMSVLILLAAGQAARIARCAPNSIAMATGNTGSLFWTGMIRAVALPVAWWALNEGHGILVMALIVLVFELLAYLGGMIMVSRLRPLELGKALPAYVAFLVVMALVLFDLWRYPPGPDLLGNLHLLQIPILGLAFGVGLAMPRIRGDGLAMIRQRFGGKAKAK